MVAPTRPGAANRQLAAEDTKVRTMTKHMKAALFGASGVVVAVGAAVFSGALDGILQRTVSPPGVETPAETDVTAVPAAPDEPAAVEVVVPVFDIVRVEPTGDAVIAGQGIPDGEVEILSGATVIARGKISPTGEWAIVLSDPLKAGVHDLTIRTRGADGSELVSQQSVAVEVPAGGQGEVLVVVNRPGAPSEVLQVPTAEAVEDAVALASAPSAPADVPQAPADVAPAAVPAATEPAATEPAAAETAPAAPPAPAVVADATPPEPAPAGSEPPAVAVATPTVDDAPAASAAPAVAATEPAAAPDAAVSPTEPVPAPAATAAAPSVDEPAPAPAAAPTATVAEPAATEPVTGGETVVVGGDPATPTVPAAPAAPVVAVAPPAPAEAVPDPAQQAAVEPAAPGIDTAAPAAAAPEPVVSVEAVELENGERFFAAGAASPGALLRIYVDDVLAGETRAMDTGRWLLDTTLPLQPGPHAVRVDHVQPDGTVLARAGVPFDIAAAEIAAVTIQGSGQGSATAGTGLAGEARVGESKTMIIRRGDNLWRIARRLYGQGVRYSTIYAANTDQIGDPDMIYPGQVFVIPEGDRNWQPAEAPAVAPPPTAVN
jgi:nucleoid-associated protein YgaU